MIEKVTKLAVLAVVAGSLSLAFVTPAEATPVGRLCSFTSVGDPTVENGQTQMGQINGGPVTDDTQAGATITLTCTIQVGAANSTHAGTDAVSLSGTGTGAASVAGQASYVSPEGQPVYLCTEVTVNGTVYYRDSVNATWSASASAACGEAISQEIFPGPLGPVLDMLAPIVDPLVDIVAGCSGLGVSYCPNATSCSGLTGNYCEDADTCYSWGVNYCQDATSCTGGGVNICGNATNCSGLVNLCN